MNRRVVVSGYPKSGNTWVTRLVAEIVECPVAGFWQRDHYEIAAEGFDRESPWRCYKSHHQHGELLETGLGEDDRVVHVVRDPRDVAVSGAAYFIRRFPRLERLSGRLGLASWYRGLLDTDRYRVARMVDVVLDGGPDVHWWVRMPWRAHVEPFLDASVFTVRYEDLLDEPLREARRICAHIGIERSDAELAAAIERQSFDVRRRDAVAAGDSQGAALLRSGSRDQWRAEFDARLCERVEEALGDLLQRLGYDSMV